MFYVDENQKARFELSYEFPLVVHKTNLRDKPRGFNDWHWHEEMQFSYILEGAMVMTCMGNDYLLRAGDGIFINSNCAHMSRPKGADSAIFLSLNIQPSLLTLFHGSVIEQKYFLPYSNDPNMQVIALSAEEPEQRLFLEQVMYLFNLIQEKGFGYELETYAQLLHVWKLLLILADRPHTQPKIRERNEAHAMLQYIHEHFSDNITIGDLAAVAHLSRGECCRIFQATYGTSIISHVIDYRISQSIPLLTGTEYSVAEIAGRCGFNNTSYYTKVFREKVGVTPLKYRKGNMPL